MASFQLLGFVLVISLLNFIHCQELCDFSDEVCMTKAAGDMHHALVSGINGNEYSTDPLTVDKIEGELETAKCKLTNILLTGMKNCKVPRLACDTKALTFNYVLRCPQIIIKTDYELKGLLGPLQVDGNGKAVITLDDFLITYDGNYEIVLNEKNQIPVISIKTFDVKTDTKGKATIDIDNLVNGDKEKSDLAEKYVQENWNEMKILLQKPITDVILTKYMRDYNKVMKSFTLEEMNLKQ